MWKKILEKSYAGYPVALLTIAIATAILKSLGEGINAITVALILLLIVLFTASIWGSGPAVLASLMAVVFLNYFFLPPVGTFTIEDPDNWIALLVFLICAVTTGQLSARAKRRAAEAEAGKVEIQRLYTELQSTFEQSSQAKALKQSEKLKTALLEAVTHDLRTPLTSIKASVTTLLQDARPATDNDGGDGMLDLPARKEMLEVIDEETDRLDRFIEGLMELAQIEAGDMKLRRQWGSVEEIIRTAVKRAIPVTRNHQINTWLDDELPVVLVDERAVTEAIYNLLDNAAKYSPAGSEIRVEARAKQPGFVTLTVEDHGSGIPAELREKVFEKFYRAMQNGDTAKKTMGTGMGLAIARGIVEAHGGRIWIEPAEERGTRVVVMLPIGDV